MLVMTRRQGETIVIGDDVKITILTVIKDCVRMGVEAPQETPIYREEIYNILGEKKEDGATIKSEKTTHSNNKKISRKIKKIQEKVENQTKNEK